MPPSIRAALLVLCGLALGAGACRARDRDPPRACPAGFAGDAARGRTLVDRLGSVPEGAAILAQVPARSMPPICFGAVASPVITTDRVVLFDAELQGAEGAARLGHLLLHAAEGLPMELPSTGDCRTAVDRALAAEARALAVEIRLRRALGVSALAGRRLPYAFEDAFWAAPAEGREALVLDYLRAHPDGAPGLDGLASGYARRCAEGR